MKDYEKELSNIAELVTQVLYEVGSMSPTIKSASDKENLPILPNDIQRKLKIAGYYFLILTDPAKAMSDKVVKDILKD